MNKVLTSLRIISGAEACSICKGDCCKNFPGETLPNRWLKNGELNEQKVLDALISNRWVVDWWEGDPRTPKFSKDDYGLYWEDAVIRVPYIRPSHTNSASITDAQIKMSGGDCAFLTDSGCELSKDERPEGCLNLKSKIITDSDRINEWLCTSAIGESFKRKAAIAWIPYADQLFDVVNRAIGLTE